MSAEPPALAHIEKTLADSYRKEIDQEENVWRSLPFFAAALALQLTVLFQLVDRLPPLSTWVGKAAIVLLTISFLCSVAALVFLATSIIPAKFRYVAQEPALLNYALELIEDEENPADPAQVTPESALVTLKKGLARQYAVATDHNRQINKRREKRRSIAGLATIAAILFTLLLVATTLGYYIPSHSVTGPAHGTEPAHAEPNTASRSPGSASAPATAPAPADAGGH